MKYSASLRAGAGSLETVVKLAGNTAVEVSKEVAEFLEASFGDAVRITRTEGETGLAKAEGTLKSAEEDAKGLVEVSPKTEKK